MKIKRNTQNFTEIIDNSSHDKVSKQKTKIRQKLNVLAYTQGEENDIKKKKLNARKN